MDLTLTPHASGSSATTLCSDAARSVNGAPVGPGDLSFVEAPGVEMREYVGADRVTLAFLCNAYEEEELEGGDVRTVLHLHPALAPFKAAVLPLQKNKLGGLATQIHEELSKYFMVDYDETGSIGKRYRRQDEVGTPVCITVDFETEETGTVTVRDRDTMEQKRIPVSELKQYIEDMQQF